MALLSFSSFHHVSVISRVIAIGQRRDNVDHGEKPLIDVPGTSNLVGSENDDLVLRIGFPVPESIFDLPRWNYRASA